MVNINVFPIPKQSFTKIDLLIDGKYIFQIILK